MDKLESSFFETHLEKDELIKWEGRPKLVLMNTEEFSFGEIFLYVLLSLIDIEITLGVIVIPILLVAAIFYFLPLVGKIIALSLLTLLLVMKFKRIKNTRYAYSNKKIYISIWNLGKRSLQVIQLDEVGKVSTELYRNGGGIIHFLPTRPFPFKGKALLSGFSRHYPTIEYVKNIKHLAAKIEDERKHFILNVRLNK